MNTKPSSILPCQPVQLPCGVVIKNPVFKSAMSDSLGDGCGNATPDHASLYARWAEGGLGLSIIGEVQVLPDYPEKPSNLVLGDKADMQSLARLAAAGAQYGAHIWPQLGHAGGLAYTGVAIPKGPSALSLNGFECEGLSRDEVLALPDVYAAAAVRAKQAGFTGVQIHAGHGFLLSQFLSPLFNRRQDEFGGDIKGRSRIILSIIARVRAAVGNAFPVGIKLNSSDQLQGGLTQEDSLAFIRMLNQSSIDLIEISGGSYFPGAASCSDAVTSGPYFVDFARQARAVTQIPLAVTGGFKSLAQVLDVLAMGIDMVGLGRGFILYPELVNNWLAGQQQVLAFPVLNAGAKGSTTAWYSMRMTALAQFSEQGFEMDAAAALDEYSARDEQRAWRWQQHFQ